MNLWKENIATNPAYYYGESSPGENYTDVSASIVEWNQGWFFTGKDYKFIRNRIGAQVYIDTTISTPYDDWGNYPLEKKILASLWFVVPQALRNTVHTIPEQIINGANFNSNSRAVRSIRLDKVIEYLYNVLDWNDANDIIDDLDSGRLDYKYIRYGREGVTEGDPEGIFDYIEANAGTSYENTGMAVKNITPVIEDTLAQVVSKVMDILRSGNY